MLLSKNLIYKTHLYIYIYIYTQDGWKITRNISKSDWDLKRRENSYNKYKHRSENINKSFSSYNHFYVKKIIVYFL